MTTPAKEPFGEAAAEALQTSVMALRLVLALADAVRGQQQRRAKGVDDALPPADQAVLGCVDEVTKVLPADIATALMGDADWPQMAQHLVALRQAGVDLSAFLPRLGDIAVTVRDQVEANAARGAREGTGERERMLRETFPAGPVREAILASPTWPDIAATMCRLDERGVDVRAILTSVHDAGVGVDQAVAKVLAGAEPGCEARQRALDDRSGHPARPGPEGPCASAEAACHQAGGERAVCPVGAGGHAGARARGESLDHARAVAADRRTDGEDGGGQAAGA